MRQYTRDELMQLFHEKIKRKEPIIASGAGSGLIASAGEKAGLDLLIVYSTGLFRLAGAPLLTTMLPYGSCNDIVARLGRKVLYRTEKIPVIGAIGAADPFKDWDLMIDQMLDAGFSGMINYPIFTGIEGFAGDLEDSGIGFSRNLALIRKCRKRDFFSSSFAFDEYQAKMLASEGADMICAMIGGTAGGTNAIKEDKVRSIEEACDIIQSIYDAVISENPEAVVTCRGGPIVGPDDLQICFDQTDVKGFIGGSSIERIPVERAVCNATREFVAVKVYQEDNDGKAKK